MTTTRNTLQGTSYPSSSPITRIHGLIRSKTERKFLGLRGRCCQPRGISLTFVFSPSKTAGGGYTTFRGSSISCSWTHRFLELKPLRIRLLSVTRVELPRTAGTICVASGGFQMRRRRFMFADYAVPSITLWKAKARIFAGDSVLTCPPHVLITCNYNISVESNLTGTRYIRVIEMKTIFPSTFRWPKHAFFVL